MNKGEHETPSLSVQTYLDHLRQRLLLSRSTTVYLIGLVARTTVLHRDRLRGVCRTRYVCEDTIAWVSARNRFAPPVFVSVYFIFNCRLGVEFGYYPRLGFLGKHFQLALREDEKATPDNAGWGWEGACVTSHGQLVCLSWCVLRGGCSYLPESVILSHW